MADSSMRTLLGEKDATIAALSQSISILQRRVEELQNECAVKSARAVDLDNRNAQLQQRIAAADHKLVGVEEASAALRARADDAVEQVQRHRAECDALRMKLLEAQQENKKMLAAYSSDAQHAPSVSIRAHEHSRDVSPHDRLASAASSKVTSRARSTAATPYSSSPAINTSTVRSFGRDQPHEIVPRDDNESGIADARVPVLQGTLHDLIQQRRQLSEKAPQTLNVSGPLHAFVSGATPSRARGHVASATSSSLHKGAPVPGSTTSWQLQSPTPDAPAMRTYPVMHLAATDGSSTVREDLGRIGGDVVSNGDWENAHRVQVAAKLGSQVRTRLESDLASIKTPGYKAEALHPTAVSSPTTEARPMLVDGRGSAAAKGVSVEPATPSPSGTGAGAGLSGTSSNAHLHMLRGPLSLSGGDPTAMSPTLVSLARLTQDADDFHTSTAILKLSSEINQLQGEISQLHAAGPRPRWP